MPKKKETGERAYGPLWYIARSYTKEEINGLVGNNTKVLELLKEVIDNMEQSVEALEMKEDLYDNPNWSHRQADLIGQKRVINKIKSLTKHLK